jgi:hypothetical protein
LLGPLCPLLGSPHSRGRADERTRFHFIGIFLILAFGLFFPGISTVYSQNQPPQILRFIEGVDAAPTPLEPDAAAAQLNDPWGALVLRRAAVFPGTLDEVLAALDNLNQGGGGVPLQSSFFVSETGLIPVNAANSSLHREFRAVVSRADAANSTVVLISLPAENREGLIELMSWDTTKQAFNFYRRPAGREWHWKGDSNDAFRPWSKGNGCFMCHVHGAPIMKELRRPWNNWNSEVASIPREAIPSPALRDSALFRQKSDANVLEPIVRGWISTTVAARIGELMKGNSLTNAPDLVRPLFESTTVNLGSSMRLSEANTPTLDLPMNFFINVDVLGDVLRPPLSALTTGSVPQVRRALYQDALTRFDFRLAEGPVCNATTFCLKGDTHFAFFVPVPSFGDTTTIRQLIARNVITQHFAQSVLMVDFPNPVYSSPRSQLLRYVPATAAVVDGRSDLAEKTAAAIVQAAATQPADSPEAAFAANWALTPDQLQAAADMRVSSYLAAVRDRVATQVGFDDYVTLAQSRRDRFAQSPLNEFPLLLPKTNLAPADLHMNSDATVAP